MLQLTNYLCMVYASSSCFVNNITLTYKSKPRAKYSVLFKITQEFIKHVKADKSN